MQVRRVRLAGIEFHHYLAGGKIDNDVQDTWNFHQHWAQLPHTFLASFALGRNLDCFDNRLVSPLRIKRIARFGLVWSRRVHQLRNAGRHLAGRNLSRNRFQDAPDMLGQNLLTGGVWMNVIRLIQARIATDAFE